VYIAVPVCHTGMVRWNLDSIDFIGNLVDDLAVAVLVEGFR